jgi:hypothetical protein
MTDVDTRLHDLAHRLDDATGGRPPPVEDLVRRIGHRRRRRTVGLAVCTMAAAVMVLAGIAFGMDDDRTDVRTADQPDVTTTTDPTADIAPITTAPATVAPGATPTTAAVDRCRNSYDPSCGPFHWVPAPGPNYSLTVRVTITPSKPKVGDTVAFRIFVDDSDANLDPASVRFGVSSLDPPDQEGFGAGCPSYRTRYGFWTPPPRTHGRVELTFTRVFEAPGSYRWGFTAMSARCDNSGPGVPPSDLQGEGGYNPYSSYGSESGELEVAGADDTTTTTESTTTTTTTTSDVSSP